MPQNPTTRSRHPAELAARDIEAGAGPVAPAPPAHKPHFLSRRLAAAVVTSSAFASTAYAVAEFAPDAMSPYQDLREVNLTTKEFNSSATGQLTRLSCHTTVAGPHYSEDVHAMLQSWMVVPAAAVTGFLAGLVAPKHALRLAGLAASAAVPLAYAGATADPAHAVFSSNRTCTMEGAPKIVSMRAPRTASFAASPA